MSLNKHFRMPEETVKCIESRDKEKYPTESSFVIGAIHRMNEKEEEKKIMEELHWLHKKVDSICEKLSLSESEPVQDGPSGYHFDNNADYLRETF